jgi:lipopolysaccharide assembly outer membrane protein LptD (OstA)
LKITRYRYLCGVCLTIAGGIPLLGQDSPQIADSEQASVPPEAAQETAQGTPAETFIERISFEVPFALETGGGVATGTAGALEYLRRDMIVASQAVEFEFQNVRLLAETVTVDLATKHVTAEGNVILDEGPKRLTGNRLEYDLEARTGTVFEGQAFVDPDVYFTGAEITKVGEDSYTVRDGTITSCSENKTPDWSFKLGTAKVNLNGFARVKNSRLRVKKLPVFYSPYMLFPAKRGRVSGLLFPNFGYSSRRGSTIGLAYFQTLGNSYDMTLFTDLYGKDYLGVGTEFRYRPSHTTNGYLQAYAIDDPIEEKTRWKATWRHSNERLPFNMRAQVDYRDFSDFDFFRDFERDFNDITIRSLYSNGYITGNWGSHSLNIMADERETFIRTGVQVVQRQLPEIEYRLRARQLGSLPLYLELLTSANYFQIDRTNTLQANYGRADFFPTLTVPLSYWPWLSVTLSASGRATWYGDSLTQDGLNFSGESLSRVFPAGSADITGPSFSRIFEKKIGSFGKFKHIIEPKWRYSFTGEFDDQELVPLFDEIDNLRDRTIVGFSLVNRLLAKPIDEELGGGAREILSFEVGQQFSLRDEQPFQQSRDKSMSTTDGPIGALLRFNPSRRFSLELRSRYSTLFNELDQASLLGGVRLGLHAFSVSWVAQKDAELDQTRSNQARVGTDLTLVRNRLQMQNQFNYDFVDGRMQQQRHILYYTSQCFGLRLEFRERTSSSQRDQDIRFAVSLKNIGTFFDMGFGGGNQL